MLNARPPICSPVWFVCCRPSPRESWNYISPSVEPGKHLLWDRNGCRYSLKPVTKKGAQWDRAFSCHLHASLNITAVFNYCGVCLCHAQWLQRGLSTIFWFQYCDCCDWTSVAVWDVSQSDACNRPLSKDLSRENLLCHPTRSDTIRMLVQPRPKTHMW